MEENKQTENETLDTNVNAEESNELEQAKARIAELEEIAKNKSIEARIAKKESKTIDPNEAVLARLERMELKENGLNDEEIELVKKEAEELGTDPLKLVKKGLANGILETYRKAKQDEAATPGTQSRGNASLTNTVEYWVAKGGLPEDRQLAVEVTKARQKQSSTNKMFNY